jgi:DNA-binding transcriptional regulator YiaG
MEIIPTTNDMLEARANPPRRRVYDGFILVEEWENGTRTWHISDAAASVSPSVMSSKNTFGDGVKALRVALRQSQRGFSDLLGIPLSTVQGWEQNRRSPHSAGKRLLHVAMCKPEALIGAKQAEEALA